MEKLIMGGVGYIRDTHVTGKGYESILLFK
jgi:hypothetical protein